MEPVKTGNSGKNGKNIKKSPGGRTKSDETAEKIARRAAELGFERCGIIGVGAMRGFAAKLEDRISRFPESAPRLKFLSGFIEPDEKFRWGKSVVVCSWRNGIYRVPEHLEGRIGKAYLSDGRRDAASDEYNARRKLADYMSDGLGLRVASESGGWIAPYRWAAQLTGLGIVRRNNFFYGEHGSYYSLSAYLIDGELERVYGPDFTPCPEGCDRCVRNCPTASLDAPYSMNMTTCVSYLTTLSKDDEAFKKHRSEIGGWIYGCDACQDACPFNRGQMSGEADFPGLAELSRGISLEKILAMDYALLRGAMTAKFWYIGPDDVWKWKRNALSAMLNDYRDSYAASIEAACLDEDERVREMAGLALAEIA
jgi:epoxyqueuosine reductase